ncbi:FlgD immunoglobulin-like domain containing protein [Micromonospora sp. NPDC051006]|uniref:FlgD immunoglobulin-like domain containing protein n=1 Tax=Micromonospora sp. NPDC051006 TaxID=3364283 RepID=UPI00378FACAE
MARRAPVRASVAAAMSIMLAAGLVPLTAGPAHADPVAGEVVIPASIALRPQTALLSAGPSGFLRYEYGRGHLWTSYAGVDTVVDPSAAQGGSVPDFGAGSDIVAHHDSTARSVALRDMSSGRSRTVVLPTGHQYVSTLGWTVVTRTGNFLSADTTWHLLDTHDDGRVTQRPVQGVPAGVLVTFKSLSPLADAHGQVVQYRTSAGGHVGWLDADQGRLIPLPYRQNASPGLAALTPTHLLWWQDGVVFIHSRADLTATPRTVPLTGDAQLLGMVGETLIVSRYDASLGSPSYLLPVRRVEVVALDGTTRKTLLARSSHTPMPTPDGALLVPGGTGWDQWGVSLLEAADDGEVAVRRVAEAYPQPIIQAADGLTFTQGRLNTMETDLSQGWRYLHTRDIGVTGSLTVGPRVDRGPVPASCDTLACPSLHDTGDGRTVVAGAWGNPAVDQQPHLLEPTEPLPGTRIDASRVYQSVAAVSGRFAALTAPANDPGAETQIVDLNNRLSVYKTTDTVEAMWGTTLWVRDGNDTVVPVDLLTGQRGAQVWFGPMCLLDDLQAVGRWLLWTCVGSAAGQGVYDTVKKTKLTLVSGSAWSRARLGDGFVASEADGQLKVTDVRSGTPVSHTAGEFASWRPWDVDPYTGLIAHVGADGGIHLVPSGVPVSPLAQLDATVATSVDVRGGTRQWTPKWWLNRPAASWTLVIRNQATGATVRTLSGGLARGLVATAWNGTDGSGRVVPNGAYTWTLTATAADGQGAALTTTGTVRLVREWPGRNRFRVNSTAHSSPHAS